MIYLNDPDALAVIALLFALACMFGAGLVLCCGHKIK